MILETFEDDSTVSYQYDNTGALATMTDSATGRKTTYYYDLTDRLMKYVESGSSYEHSAETGLYHLWSRYYDPQTGRFINADVLTSTGQGMLGYNMFAYCLNNPVCRKEIWGATSVSCFNPEDVNPTDDDEDIAGGKMNNSDTGKSVIRIGGGHGNPEHKQKIENHMDDLEQSGEYSTIYGNRSLKTAGLVGNQRPDVIAVQKGGRVEVWEFASPSQVIGGAGYYTLQEKIDIMAAANPTVIFHAIIHW